MGIKTLLRSVSFTKGEAVRPAVTADTVQQSTRDNEGIITRSVSSSTSPQNDTAIKQLVRKVSFGPSASSEKRAQAVFSSSKDSGMTRSSSSSETGIKQLFRTMSFGKPSIEKPPVEPLLPIKMPKTAKPLDPKSLGFTLATDHLLIEDDAAASYTGSIIGRVLDEEMDAFRTLKPVDPLIAPNSVSSKSSSLEFEEELPAVVGEEEKEEQDEADKFSIDLINPHTGAKPKSDAEYRYLKLTMMEHGGTPDSYMGQVGGQDTLIR